MNPLLELSHVSYSYHEVNGETLALSDISFQLESGSFLAIVGPSGCGKSTLLSLISGLLEPEEGTISFLGKSLREAGSNIGYMLQKDQLLEWRTTWHNVLLGPEIRGGIRPEHRQRAEELLKLYGLYEFRNSYPSELSGGMRQRAALIRTLMTEPELLLLDEPFSALDYQTRLRVSDDIWNIIKEQKKTAILITHDISEAVSMADRVLVLSGRPGTILRDIPIRFASLSERTPFAARSAVEFKDYFQQIWKEMNRNEETE